MKPTINDIAKASGFSRSTVSRVLRKSTKVDQKTRKIIEKTIKEMNYKPNKIARSLVKGSTDIISLIVGDITNPFYVEASKVIQEEMYEAGYMLVLCNSDYDNNLEDKYLDAAMENQFAGIFMMSATGSKEKLNEIINNNIPLVLINRFMPSINTDAILVDDHKGAYMATKYLYELGHKRIAILNGPERSSASKNTRRGYIDMMKEAGLEIKQGYIVEGDLKREAGYKFGMSLIDNKSDITAVLCSNEIMASGIVDAYIEHGRSIPDDLSIIGYDLSTLTYDGKIKLTTIGVPQKEIGRAAVEVILSRLKENNKNKQYRKIVLEPNLYIGDSTTKYNK